MATKLQPVRSLEEFRRLYYPDKEPALDYFDGVGPVPEDEEGGDDTAAVADPLDRFADSRTSKS